MNVLATLQKTGRFLRKNLAFYLTGFLILLGIKLFYSRADCQELRWILGPTAGWVTLLSGISFAYLPGEGYVNHSLRILIAPSCSGVQFMLITMATLLFSFVHRAAGNGTPSSRSRKGFLWTAACLPLSYLTAIFVNGLRIIAAIYLPALLAQAGLSGADSPRCFLTPEKLHTAIGVLVYFVSLLTIYRLGGYFFQRSSAPQDSTDSSCSQAPAGCNALTDVLAGFLRRCLPPLFWYFAFVLGIPFLNKGLQKNGSQFTSFAALTGLCCGAVLCLYLAVLTGRRLWKLLH